MSVCGTRHRSYQVDRDLLPRCSNIMRVRATGRLALIRLVREAVFAVSDVAGDVAKHAGPIIIACDAVYRFGYT